MSSDVVSVKVKFSCECTMHLSDRGPYHETLGEAIRLATQDIQGVKITNVSAEFVEDKK